MRRIEFSCIFAVRKRGLEKMIITPTNRDDIRRKAIDTTTDIVLRDGNLTVRMDDVAQELSVSKRTLYEIFSSKEDLLVECMQNHMCRMGQLIRDEINHEEDVLTVFLKHLEIIVKESREADHNRFCDMDKYPRLKKVFMEHMEEMKGCMRRFMELGVKQGVFRDDLDMDVVMMAFSTMGRATSEEAKKGTFDYEKLINGTMVVLLRGIATPKGMEKLEKYLRASYREMEDWEDVLMIAKQMAPDDMIVMINARPSTPSFNPLFEQVPDMLTRFFSDHSYMVLYPEQETGIAVPDLLTGDTTQTSRMWKIVSALKRAVLSFQQRAPKDRKASRKMRI